MRLVTTHDWSTPVDVDHLADIRRRAATLTPDATHLVLEVLAYALDESAAEGTTRSIRVVLHADGSIEVVDDGRGTDTRADANGVLHVKPVMATRDVRFFDAPGADVLADGRPRQGMSAVAAVSPRLIHEHRREWNGVSPCLPGRARRALSGRTHRRCAVTVLVLASASW